MLDRMQRLAARLLASGKKQGAVMRQCEVSRSTLARWKRLPEFKEFIEREGTPEALEQLNETEVGEELEELSVEEVTHYSERGQRDEGAEEDDFDEEEEEEPFAPVRPLTSAPLERKRSEKEQLLDALKCVRCLRPGDIWCPVCHRWLRQGPPAAQRTIGNE